MSECDAVVKICANSSLNEIHVRVQNGTKVAKACKEVAEEFNANNPGATTTFEALRTAYYRSQKCVTDTVSKKKKCVSDTVSKKLDVPILTPKQQDTVDSLMHTCKNLRGQIKELKDQLYVTAQEAVNIQVENEKLKAQVAQLTGKRPEQQTNEEFVEQFKEDREKRIKKMRTINGYNEDGTTMN